MPCKPCAPKPMAEKKAPVKKPVAKAPAPAQKKAVVAKPAPKKEVAPKKEAAPKKPVLTAEQKAVLKAIRQSKTPVANKQIVEKTALEGALISEAVKVLRKVGYVDSPERAKYVATEAGKKAR